MRDCPNPSWCEINSCNGKCKTDPYGVPTGYVPRVKPAGPADLVHYDAIAAGYTPRAQMHGEAIQQAVDDYILMERKARAWDRLSEIYVQTPHLTLLTAFAKLEHPAPTSSTR